MLAGGLLCTYICYPLALVCLVCVLKALCHSQGLGAVQWKVMFPAAPVCWSCFQQCQCVTILFLHTSWKPTNRPPGVRANLEDIKEGQEAVGEPVRVRSEGGDVRKEGQGGQITPEKGIYRYYSSAAPTGNRVLEGTKLARTGTRRTQQRIIRCRSLKNLGGL